MKIDDLIAEFGTTGWYIESPSHLSAIVSESDEQMRERAKRTMAARKREIEEIEEFLAEEK
jgi:hypothetical protein